MVQKPKGCKSRHFFGKCLVNACGVRYTVVNKEQNGHNSCLHGLNSPGEYLWVILFESSFGGICYVK